MELGILVGVGLWFALICVLSGFYTVEQNERAVKTVFGRAQRLPGLTSTQDAELAATLNENERQRYAYPVLKVIPPGGPYFKFPWERIHKVSIAIENLSIAYDPENPAANHHGTVLEAVTMDQLNTGLTGQIRFRVSEKNLYAYLFGIKQPIAHAMGYFVSILRERIATFQAPSQAPGAEHVASGLAEAGVVSINDIRKNLRALNESMDRDCKSSVARYGIVLDASLITGIDPPKDIESALAAINTAHNHVSSEISVAQAAADQRIVQSKRAVEIETLKAQAEVEPLTALAGQLSELKKVGGAQALMAYLRNVKLGLFSKTKQLILETATHEGR